MKKRKLTIGGKIFGGFIALIITFTLSAVVSIVTINGNNEIVKETSQVIDPSENALKDFTLLVTESKMLITNWVYLQGNQEDKEELKELHNFRYPDLKRKLSELAENWNDSTQEKRLDSLFTSFEDLLAIEKDIMKQLVTFEDYEDPMVKLLSEESIESEVLPRTKEIRSLLGELSAEKQEEARVEQAKLISSSQNLRNTILILGIITVVIGLACAFVLTRNITRPINRVKDIILKLSKGELPKAEELGKNTSSDEVGQMSVAVDDLVTGLEETSGFAAKIGKGEYDTEFNPLSEKDVLGNSLLEMRDNLKRVAEDDKKRSWATEGTAKFGEILRQNNHDVKALSDNILSSLIKYMQANQGGLYLIQDNEESEDPYMEMEACYAWGRKKYIEQKVYIGEGLAGQVWLEKDTVYLTEVPDEYISIASGLGEANPTSILIVPLVVNEEVHGVIELASFNEFSDYEIEFVEKIAESIASTISSAKVNAQTKALLEESQTFTEQMQSQEEEMRQNMEELQATQEEMGRKQQELEDVKQKLEKNSSVLKKSIESYKAREKNLKEELAQKEQELKAVREELETAKKS